MSPAVANRRFIVGFAVLSIARADDLRKYRNSNLACGGGGMGEEESEKRMREDNND